MTYGLWVVLGMALGAAAGWFLGDLALGIGLGAIVGVVGGAAITDWRERREADTTPSDEAIPPQTID